MVHSSINVNTYVDRRRTDRSGITYSSSRQCQTARQNHEGCLYRLHAAGREHAEEKGRLRVEVPADRMGLTVTWRTAGNCLHLFASDTIQISIFPNRMIDKQSIHWDFPHSSGTRKVDNGFVPVSISTHSSSTLQRTDGASTSGATVGHYDLSLTTAVLNFFTDCGDILTKPKLDKHRVICHASFDCIDCGKRFETPADYKGHTSCISEAEKYQKGLYNGGVGGCIIQNIPVTLTDRKIRAAPKEMVEVNDGGNKVEEGSGGITDSDGNNET